MGQQTQTFLNQVEKFKMSTPGRISQLKIKRCVLYETGHLITTNYNHLIEFPNDLGQQMEYDHTNIPQPS